MERHVKKYDLSPEDYGDIVEEFGRTRGDDDPSAVARRLLRLGIRPGAYEIAIVLSFMRKERQPLIDEWNEHHEMENREPTPDEIAKQFIEISSTDEFRASIIATAETFDEFREFLATVAKPAAEPDPEPDAGPEPETPVPPPEPAHPGPEKSKRKGRRKK